MKTITSLLKAAKVGNGIDSERELARRLNLGPSSNITRWRQGTMSPADDHVFRLAEAAGVDPKESLVRVRLEEQWLKAEIAALRTEEPARSVYREVSRRIAAAMATIGCVLVLLATTSAGAMPVEHTGNTVPLEARNLYIMRYTDNVSPPSNPLFRSLTSAFPTHPPSLSRAAAMDNEGLDSAIRRLVDVMAQLRNPKGGCPWDLEQNFATIAPYTIEEAYEVADAIERQDMASLRDELGDLLLQVVFHARMAQEAEQFDLQQVADAISEKMIRRHPHVFGSTVVADADAQTRAWEEHKANERRAQAESSGKAPSALDGVAVGLPALLRALKLQRRAARVGFDWPEARDVLGKMQEELDEIRAELADGRRPERVLDEVGDLLFVCANLARHLDVDPEAALRHANSKFERRFRHIERRLSGQGRELAGATLDEMETLWQEAKKAEAGR